MSVWTNSFKPYQYIYRTLVILWLALSSLCIYYFVWDIRLKEPNVISPIHTETIHRTNSSQDCNASYSKQIEFFLLDTLLHGKTQTCSKNLHPVCELLFPSSMMFLTHHKTGTLLARKIHAILCDYCGMDNSSWYLVFNPIKTATTHTWIHFIRDPVLTIVSGFVYHMTCTEYWASRRLSTDLLRIASMFFDAAKDPFVINAKYKAYLNSSSRSELTDQTLGLLRQFNATDNIMYGISKYQHKSVGQRTMIQQMRDIYLYYMNSIASRISLKHYGDYYGFNIDFDDLKIHEEYNIFRGRTRRKEHHFAMYRSFSGWMVSFRGLTEMKYGLYFEMLRYLFVVYPAIHYVHFETVSNATHAYELKMESWQNDFDYNMNIILDALNLNDSPQNNKILRQNGWTRIDIQQERQVLANRLKSHDPSQSDSNHVHIGRNDTKYIHELLTLDPHICLLMKHVTNLIQYRWRYSEYC
eukprot:514851_1